MIFHSDSVRTLNSNVLPALSNVLLLFSLLRNSVFKVSVVLAAIYWKILVAFRVWGILWRHKQWTQFYAGNKLEPFLHIRTFHKSAQVCILRNSLVVRLLSPEPQFSRWWHRWYVCILLYAFVDDEININSVSLELWKPPVEPYHICHYVSAKLS